MSGDGDGDSARVRVRVRDHGPGVPPDLVAAAFRPFTQLGGRQRGIGLGLSIAPRLAEANGGSVRSERPADGGACFELSLPLAETGGEVPEPDRRPHGAGLA